MRKKTEFTNERIAFITSNYLLMSAKDIGEKLGIHGDVVSAYLRTNNMIVPKEIKNAFRTKWKIGWTSFSEEEDSYIKNNYLLLPINTMAKHLGRSDSGVKNRIKNLGLIIPPEIIEQNKQSARIQLGNVPFNKGRKQSEYMSEDMIKRTAKTRFKKGNQPPNTYTHDGIIVTRNVHSKRGDRPYQYIRLAPGKWRELHLVLWEKENGKLPAGHCLWFRDGNSLNVTLDNLELITRKENYIRNSGINRLNDTYVASCIAWRNKELQAELLKHPELIEMKRQSLLLNKTIKAKNPPA